MFCEKCGTTLEEGVTTCPNCNGADDVAVMAPANKSKATGIAAVAAVVIIVIVALALIFGGGPKKKLKKYLNFELNAKGSASKMVNDLTPKKLLKELLDEMDMSKKELIKEVKEEQKERREDLKDSGRKYKYEILDCEKVRKNDDDFEELKDYLKEEYKLRVTKAKKYIVKITVYEDGKKEDSYTRNYYMYKINGKWYPSDGMF